MNGTPPHRPVDRPVAAGFLNDWPRGIPVLDRSSGANRSDVSATAAHDGPGDGILRGDGAITYEEMGLLAMTRTRTRPRQVLSVVTRCPWRRVIGWVTKSRRRRAADRASPVDPSVIFPHRRPTRRIDGLADDLGTLCLRQFSYGLARDRC